MENIKTNKSLVEARIPKTPHIVAQTNKKSPIVVTNIFILTVSFHSGMLYRLRPDYLVSTAHLKILFLYIILNFLSINLTSTIHVPGYPGAAVLRADLPIPLICKLKFYSTVFITRAQAFGRDELENADRIFVLFFLLGVGKLQILSQSLAVTSFNHSCVRIYFASFSWSTRAFSLVADLQNGGEKDDLQTSD